MPITVSVSGDFERFSASFRESAQKQVRYAARIALNNVAKAAVADIKAKMPDIFDRPTPSTVNAEFIRFATASNLTATVGIKDFIGKGPPPQDWLSAEISGGTRQHKRSENALIAAGVMQPDQFWTPGDALEGRLNAYGNVPSGVITTILSRVSAFGEQGYKANVSDATRKKLRRQKLATARTGTNFFVWHDSDGRARAIMQLMGKGHVEPVLYFTGRAPVYAKKFRFGDEVLAFVETHFNAEMAKTLEIALATARD